MLDWQVQMAHELRNFCVGVDQPLREFLRMRCCVADPFDAGNVGDVFDQRREVGELVRAVAVAATIGVDVLPEQRDLAHTLVGEAGDFREHVGQRSRYLVAACVRAPRSKLQNLLQPSMIETKAVGPSTFAGGRWSNFSISGKLMSTLRSPGRAALADHRGQAVQRLGAEHEIDVGRHAR